MSDDTFDRDLESIAGSIPGMPGPYAQLQSLLQSLPSALPPDIRSAITGQVSTSEPGTSQAQIASSMSGQAPGSESGAAIGVVSEIYYANSNLLNNATMAGQDSSAAVAIGVGNTYWADQWQAKYVLNSGVAPATITIALNDSRFQANGFHPFNVNQPFLSVAAGAAAFDITVEIYPFSGWQQFFDTELAFITAAFKVWGGGFVPDANTTIFQTWVELWDINGAGTLLASSTVIDWLAAGVAARDDVYRQTAFDETVASGTYQYLPKLKVRIAKNSAGGSEFMNFGEAVLALATTQNPPPFAPIVGRWRPSQVQVNNAGDVTARMLVGSQNDTAAANPTVEWGAGGSSGRDIKLLRRNANVLSVEGANSAAAASVDMPAQAAPATPAASRGRLYFDSATKHFFQIDDAGVLTDLAAGGGGGGLPGGVPALTLGTANAAGVAASAVRTDATILAFDATVPVTQAFADAAAVGAATVAARRDHKHGMPANPTPAFAVPAVALGTAGAAGAAGTIIRSDSTIAAFDATVPVTQAFADAAATGAAAFAARRDHKHGMPAAPSVPAFAVPAIVLGTVAAAGAAGTVIRSDATVVAFDATAAAALTSKTPGAGAAALASRNDHTHSGQISVTDAVSLAGDYLMRAKIAADAGYRIQIGHDAADSGEVKWGSGAGAFDVSLSRDAASSLKLSNTTVLNLSGSRLTLPVTTSAGAVEGRMRQVTSTSATDGTRIVSYDTQRERDIASRGWQPYAYPIGAAPDQAYATALVIALSGGAAAIPFTVDGHLLLQSVTYRATAAGGAAEFRIYVERLNNGLAGENTLDEVPSSAGTLAAAGAAGNITGNVTAVPLYLGPGIYWLVIRTTTATALNLGTLVAGTLAANTFQTKTIGALAATLDFVAATWTKQTSIPGVRLNGRVFGQTAAF